MPVISDSWGYLFIMSPRTGSSAIADGVLFPHLDGRWLPEDEVTDPRTGKVLVARKHAPLGALLRHGVLTRQQARGLLKFTTVRNPFDSMASLYVKQRDTYQPLLEDPGSWVHRRPAYVEAMTVATDRPFGDWLRFVLAPRTPRQRAFAAVRGRYYPRHLYRAHLQGVDVVLRQESLQQDFEKVLDRLGVAAELVIPSYNVTEAKTDSYQSLYDDETRAFAERVFAPDLRRFGYRF